MSRRNKWAGWVVVGIVALCSIPSLGWADTSEKLLIPVGHAQVVVSDGPVKTVAIAEPKIADAAVGSERTVVVNAKNVGTTSLVVYGEGGRFKVYDIAVFAPGADKQVSLHVQVAELDKNAVLDLGIDLTGQGKPFTPGHDDVITGGLFTTKITSPDIPQSLGPETDAALQYVRPGNLALTATWKLLQQKGDIRLLANPTLVAKSGEKASFLVGGEFPVPIASSAIAGQTTVTIEWKEFGVRLNFTPWVDADGGVTLLVAPEVSQLNFTNPLQLNGFRVPILDTRKTSTTVHLNPGEHLIVGGLKQTEKTHIDKRVPILGSVPLLGYFFKNTHDENVERDLVVLVSPEVIEGGSTTMPPLPTDTKHKN